MSSLRALALCLLAALIVPPSSSAMDGPGGGKAFLLSLVVPGLGHRYVNGGDWDGSASAFLAADVGLWLGLIGTSLRHEHLTNNYTTLAALRADADVAGKNRTYFLTVGTYRSSEEFLDVQLRSRAWDQLSYVDERSFQWEWESEVDFQRYRGLREDAETMRRRRPLIAALLLGNRLVSGLLALRSAGSGDVSEVALSFAPLQEAPDRPAVRLSARF